MRSHGWLLLAITAASGLGLWRLLTLGRGRRLFDRLLLTTVGIRTTARGLAISRFCRVLGTLLQNGVPILPALRIARDAGGNRALAAVIDNAADDLSTGRSLIPALAASGYFEEEITEMLAVGEEANNLEQVLLDLAENLERDTARRLDLLVRMVEPVLLLVIAGFILFIALGLLLPIFQTAGVVF